MSQDMEREVMEDLATGTQPSPADESFEAFEEEGLEGGDTMEEEFDGYEESFEDGMEAADELENWGYDAADVHIFIDFGQLCSWKPDTDVHGNRTPMFMISATRFQPGQHT
jgi:hypothetical protein